MRAQQTVKIFLTEGNPTGLRTLELFNWNGKGVIIPRDRIESAIQREELKTQGVYILLGESEQAEEMIYIGESENISDRIKSHHKNKNFWDTSDSEKNTLIEMKNNSNTFETYLNFSKYLLF